MAQPSIKQLDAFWWAATSANFVTAAERLNLSVSSLSKRISGLESLLGETLFDRSGHKASLTDAGERLLPGALTVLNAVAALRQDLGRAGVITGHCRFGVGDLSALTWLPSFVASVRQAHPDLQLEVVVDFGGRLEQQLADPAVNVPAGARYLNYLLKLFPGRLDLALAAYNAGEGAVRKAGQAIPPFKETRNYVKAVLGIYEQLQAGKPHTAAHFASVSLQAPAAGGQAAAHARVRMTLPAPSTITN